MGAWGFLVDVLESVGLVLLLIAVGWAALERGRIHRQLAGLRCRSGGKPATHVGGWRAERKLGGLFRVARRSRRIFLAVGAVSGWV